MAGGGRQMRWSTARMSNDRLSHPFLVVQPNLSEEAQEERLRRGWVPFMRDRTCETEQG
eukprot:SAG31_NODE_37653_length_302_cov_1.024631_1_plen_59_part_00